MSAMKAFPQFTREYIRNGISYLNLMYILKTIAPYRSDSKEDKKPSKGNNKNKKPEKVTHFEQFNF